ncbi:MAG: hypothetical protein ACE5NM_11455 [Sedimentisphaerales bacterium]
MKTVILTLACLLLATACQAAEKQLTPEQQIKQRLRIQKERLKDIEELAVSERQAIEQWYARHLAELRQLAERQARRLRLSERALWAEFIKMSNQIPFADSYFSSTARTYWWDKKGLELRPILEDSYFLTAAAELLMDSNFCKLLSDIADGSAYNPQSFLIRSEARKLLPLAKEFESELMRLESRRNDRLAGLERWEKGLQRHVYKVMRQIKALPETPELGVVSAISYDEKGSLCMIDGVDKVLQPGDTIQNVTVVRIHQDRVEFAKAGQKWVQKIDEPANPAWR